MSAGGFSYALSVAAAAVLRSLMEHPERPTAAEIAGAPNAEVDADGAAAGLRELEELGFAEQGADGRWQVTEAGRAVA